MTQKQIDAIARAIVSAVRAHVAPMQGAEEDLDKIVSIFVKSSDEDMKRLGAALAFFVMTL